MSVSKYIFPVIVLTAICFVPSVLAQRYVEGEVLVKYKNGTASAEALTASPVIGAGVLERYPDLGWQRVRLPAHLPVERAVALYRLFEGVEAVQPNYYYRLAATPDDTRFAELYGMQKISAPVAWEQTTGSPATVVAVIDTGIKYTHEDLATNMWTNDGEIEGNGVDDDGNGFIDDYYGYDFFYDDPDPDDEHGHGTHVAGTIGAVGNNSLGVVGVNWNVRLMAIKIYDATGFGSTSAMLINAYNYVRMMRKRGVNIRVTNNSYAGCDEACGYDQATKDALDALGRSDVLQVFAAGNRGRDADIEPEYPAGYNSPTILSVAASNAEDNRAGFSNFGPASVDLAAPGVGILSTVKTAANYGFSSGTSMASPHVAGAAALLAAYNPALSARSLKATILNTADALPQWEGVVRTGGRLNAAAALANQTACRIGLDRNRQRVFPEGGSFSVAVTAGPNCDYQITADGSFVGVTSGETASGPAVVTFDVGPNQGPPRRAVITIGNRELTIEQDPGKISPHRGFLDFDGDGRTDYAALENLNGRLLWHNYRSVLGYAGVEFGLFADDVPVPALYDADLTNDIAVWRRSNGTFYILRSGDNTVQIIRFGMTGDDPTITQDFDGDERADPAVVRKENGKLIWYIALSTGGIRILQFGNETDRPLRGDFDGDGRADPTVYRPASDSPANTFFILKSTDGGLLAVPFGISTTDRTVVADYDGDGKTDFAVWRETTGVWHYLSSADGGYRAVPFGNPGDLPVPGDYDGDGRTEFAVWRPNGAPDEAGAFHVLSVWTGYTVFGWGNAEMKIPAALLRSR